MKEERILTLHPQGKKGVNIIKSRCDFIKNHIIATLNNRNEISYQELDILANQELKNLFDRKKSWYVITVKLALEARNKIEIIPKTSPHKLRLSKHNN